MGDLKVLLRKLNNALKRMEEKQVKRPLNTRTDTMNAFAQTIRDFEELKQIHRRVLHTVL